MITTVQPGSRTGCVTVPSSKSVAHRQLICAALSNRHSEILCDGISKDIEATMRCLCALGTPMRAEADGRIVIEPFEKETPEQRQELRHLYCGESGSTLRFLMPLVGALGCNAVFHMEGKLPQRPVTVLSEQLCAHGMQIHQEGELLYVSGQLQPGTFVLPGNISSQYISGILLAAPVLDGDSELKITEHIESADYITMTEDAIRASGVTFSHQEETQTYQIPGRQHYQSPEHCVTERDWSGAAFFLCMGALSEKGITICGLSEHSAQGDRRIAAIMEQFGAEVRFENGNVFVRKGHLKGCTIDAQAIPDLVPTISAVAALSEGETVITHAERLRIKESDRLRTVSETLNALGADVTETADGLIIQGKKSLSGGEISPSGDHRIAMTAAVAASGCSGTVTVTNAECVQKSYPGFWTDLDRLEVEQ